MRLSKEAKELADAVFKKDSEEISAYQESSIQRLTHSAQGRRRKAQISRHYIQQIRKMVKARIATYIEAFRKDSNVPNDSDIDEICHELGSIIEGLVPNIGNSVSERSQLERIILSARQELAITTQKMALENQQAIHTHPSNQDNNEAPKAKRWVIDYIKENKQWIFSGIGVFILSSFLTVTFFLWKYYSAEHNSNNAAKENPQSSAKDEGNKLNNKPTKQVFLSYMQSGYDAYGKGDYGESERMFRTALDEANNVNTGDKESSDLLLLSLNGLGIVLQVEGRYEEAEPINRRFVEIMEKVRKEDDPEYAMALNNLGQNLANLKKYEEAEEVHRKALSLREKYESPAHSDIGVSLGNLGRVYYEEENYNQAEALLVRAIKILADIPHSVRDESETVHLAYANLYLGLVYEQTNNFKQAEIRIKNSIDLMISITGNGHPAIVPFYNTYAEFLQKMNRNTEASRIEAQIEDIKAKRNVVTVDRPFEPSLPEER
jgi:tetratricopeptide (TPR) repeat protein